MLGIFRDEPLYTGPATGPGTTPEEIKEYEVFSFPEPNKWIPKIRTGFFYSQDRQYYLFDKKATAYLAELTWTKLRLADIITPGTETVKLRGIELDEEHYRLDGPFIEINHASLDSNGTHIEDLHLDVSVADPYQYGVLFGPDEILEVSGSYEEIVPGTSTFTTKSFIQYLPLSSGETIYRFPLIPSKDAPIIITDDSIESWDVRQICPEFTVDYETGEIQFNGYQNLFYNGDFSSDLDYWVIYGPTTAETTDSTLPELQQHAYTGQKFARLNTTGLPNWAGIAQDAPMVSGQAYYLSFRARREGGSGVAPFYIDVDFLDSSKVQISTQTINLQTSSADWELFDWTIGRANQIRDPDIEIPTGTAYFRLSIYWTGNADQYVIHVDAVQLVKSRFPVEFFDAHPLCTVEYEVGDGVWYDHDRLLTYNRHGKLLANQFPLEEVNFNPIRHAVNSGFLYFIEEDGVSDFQLGKGGSVYDEDDGVSFVKGRSHLRYAKTTGVGKYIQVGILGLGNPHWTEEMSLAGDYPIVAKVIIESPHNTIQEQLLTTISVATGQHDTLISAGLLPLYATRGNMIVRPGATDEFIVAFDQVIGGQIRLSQPIGEALPAATAIAIETRTLVIPNGTSTKVISIVTDIFENTLGQVTVDFSGSLTPANVDISYAIEKTNSDGQIAAIIEADTGASGIGSLQVVAGGVTDTIRFEVV